MRPLCAHRWCPASRLPRQTPFGSLPPPFPTTLPPQGDPERVVGNGSGKWWLRWAGGGDTTGAPAQAARFRQRFLPRTPVSFAPPSHPRDRWSPQRFRLARNTPTQQRPAPMGSVAVRAVRPDHPYRQPVSAGGGDHVGGAAVAPGWLPVPDCPQLAGLPDHEFAGGHVRL